ncbi:MAG: peptidylprolyl isomerase, partial [Victivallaceae bacterium]
QITLDDLIGRRLILSEYDKKPFPIKLQHIEDIVNDFMREIGCSTRAELEHKLSESGVSMEKMRQRARERIIIEAMLGQQMYLNSNVTPRMINEEFTRLAGKYDEAPQVDLKLIMLDRGDKNFTSNNAVVLDELSKNPDSFDELAGKYSVGPGNNNNGKLGWIKVPDLRGDFKAAIGEIDAGKKGDCFGPIDDGTMVYYLKLEDYKPGKKVDPVELRSMIKRNLELKLRASALDKYVKKLRSKAVIRYF